MGLNASGIAWHRQVSCMWGVGKLGVDFGDAEYMSLSVRVDICMFYIPIWTYFIT